MVTSNLSANLFFLLNVVAYYDAEETCLPFHTKQNIYCTVFLKGSQFSYCVYYILRNFTYRYMFYLFIYFYVAYDTIQSFQSESYIKSMVLNLSS